MLSNKKVSANAKKQSPANADKQIPAEANKQSPANAKKEPGSRAEYLEARRNWNCLCNSNEEAAATIRAILTATRRCLRADLTEDEKTDVEYLLYAAAELSIMIEFRADGEDVETGI